MTTSTTPVRPGWIGGLVIYLVFLAVVVRMLAVEAIRPLLPRYLALALIYILLYSMVLWRPNQPHTVLHLYFTLQSAIVLTMISFHPEFDFLVLLFFLLCVQVSYVFHGQMRWRWIGILVFLTGESLIFFLGVLRGLALSLTTIAAEIVIPAYLQVTREIEAARAESQVLLSDLQGTQAQLQSYASQVEELAALQERNRLARELHDTVSQLIFSISLNTRTAQLLLERDPSRVRQQLDLLQAITADALSRLRSLITQLRPVQK
jgi:signal transduction histidine kinase